MSYRSIHGSRRDAATPALIGLAAVAIDTTFVWWLFSRADIVTRDQRAVVIAAEVIIICSIGLIEVARLIQAISLSLASVIACDPIAPPPARGLRAALLTTIVPDREPLAMVTKTLAAAKKIRYPGLRVWLLDEGDAKEVRETCRRLKVKHFTRLRTRRYNTPTGQFEVRTKHGNLNAWLDAHGADYDVILCLDPDHIPNRDFADRVMGYFNDPNVAYVVGPQFYGNVEHFVSRAAESQQFPFHSVIQRAGNRYRSPMLVGTNNAIRVSALRAAGGFVASITEDVATGLVIQSQRNPATGDRWESVYVPDVLAIGEGPASWADYFGQQARWSRGGIQAIGRTFLPRVFRLRPKALLQYLLITSFYPTMALGWLLGAVNAGLFIVLHARGIIVPIGVWAALYADTTVFQLWVYMRARRHNVSPFDRSSSGGPIGMAMTVDGSTDIRRLISECTGLSPWAIQSDPQGQMVDRGLLADVSATPVLVGRLPGRRRRSAGDRIVTGSVVVAGARPAYNERAAPTVAGAGTTAGSPAAVDQYGYPALGNQRGQGLMVVVARSLRRRSLWIVGVAVLILNVMVALPYVSRAIGTQDVDTQSYEAQYGHWDTIALPAGLRVNAVHATLLDTGKILITAGSGNDLGQFQAGLFKSLIYDPVTGTGRVIYTPVDMFCGGQALLSNGDVLIAGGTQNYEVLAGQVTHAGGVMTITNESPAPGLRMMGANTELVAPNGQRYQTDAEIVIQPAVKQTGPGGKVTIIPSSTSVWVNAESKGPVADLNVSTPTHFAIAGLVAAGQPQHLRPGHHDDDGQARFQGTSFSYLFDPDDRGVHPGCGPEHETLVPDLGAALGRIGAGRQRSGRHRTDRPRRPRDRTVDPVRAALDPAGRPHSLLRHLSRAVPDREPGRPVLFFEQLRVRTGRQGPPTRFLEHQDQRLRVGARSA